MPHFPPGPPEALALNNPQRDQAVNVADGGAEGVVALGGEEGVAGMLRDAIITGTVGEFHGRKKERATEL